MANFLPRLLAGALSCFAWTAIFHNKRGMGAARVEKDKAIALAGGSLIDPERSWTTSVRCKVLLLRQPMRSDVTGRLPFLSLSISVNGSAQGRRVQTHYVLVRSHEWHHSIACVQGEVLVEPLLKKKVHSSTIQLKYKIYYKKSLI